MLSLTLDRLFQFKNWDSHLSQTNGNDYVNQKWHAQLQCQESQKNTHIPKFYFYLPYLECTYAYSYGKSVLIIKFKQQGTITHILERANFRTLTAPNAGEVTSQQKFLFTARGNAQWYRQFGSQLSSFLGFLFFFCKTKHTQHKNQKLHYLVSS